MASILPWLVSPNNPLLFTQMHGVKRGNRRFCIRTIGCGKLEQAGLRNSLVLIGGSLCDPPLSSEPKEIGLFIPLKWHLKQELIIPSAASYPGLLSVGLKSLECYKTKTAPSIPVHARHVLDLAYSSSPGITELNTQLIPNHKGIYWTSGVVSPISRVWHILKDLMLHQDMVKSFSCRKLRNGDFRSPFYTWWR